MTIKVPRDVQEMAMLVLADRKMQGWTPDDIEDLRQAYRDMAMADMEDFRAYLQTQVKPIRDRGQMVRDMVARIKARIELERQDAA